MKIIAIRGENVASLAGPFAVEFEQSPLNEQGLIAITGKTGSGKSTLLDCLCLALYEQIPRFDEESRTIEIGREEQTDRLKANDIRNLVSRGQTSAFAEVEFRTSDGCQYLARWQVRRARNQLEGRWQASSRELIDLTHNQPFSANKREFQHHIDELIGLNYEQFRRSVMLAQGDFAAFLKAAEDQRSALLERMTGTELYSRISQQVYEHNKEQLTELAKLREQLEQVSVLDDESRETLVQQLKELQQRLEQIGQAQQIQRQLAIDLSSLDEVSQRQKQAQQALASQLQQGEAIEALQEQLKRLEQLAPLKPIWSRCEQLKLQLDEQRSQQQSLQQQLEQQRLQQQTLDEQCQQSDAALKQFDEQSQQRSDELKQARELDGDLRVRQQQLNEMLTRLRQSEQQHRAEQQSLQSVKHQQEQIKLQQEQLQQWLQQHQQESRWANEFATIEPLLASYLEKAREQHYRSQLEDEAEVLRGQQRQVDAAIRERQPALTQLRQQRDERLKQLNESTDFQNKVSQISGERELLQRRQNQLEQLQSELQAQVQCQNDHEQTLQVMADSEQQQRQLEQQLLQLESALNEAREQYANARQVVDLSHYRQKLQPGHACPLCGSEEHPYLDNQVLEPVATILDQLRQRGEILAAQQQDLIGQIRELAAKQQLLQRQAAQLAIQFKQGQLRLQAWFPLLPELAEQEDRLAWVAEQLEQAEQRSVTLSQQWQTLQQQWQQWEQLRGEVEQQSYEVQQQEKQLQELQNRQQLIAQQLQQHQQALDRLDANRDDVAIESLSEQLDELFSGHDWQDYLAQVGLSGMLHWVHGQLQEYQQVIEQQSAIEQHQQQLSQQLQEQQVKADYAQKNYQALAADLEQLQQSVTEQQNQRQHLLDGMNVDEWLTLQQSQREQLQQQLQQFQEARQYFVQQQATLTGQLQSIDERLNKLEQQRQLEEQRWQQALVEYQVEAAQCHQLFAIEESEVASMRQQIQQYEQQLLVCQEQLKNQEQRYQSQLQQVEQHRSQLLEQIQQLELESEQELAKYKAELEEQSYQLRKQLDGDEQARLQSQQLHDRYQKQQQQSEVWEQLNQLIGSASGAKFRTFAQQLTLDKLLFEANRQLTELAPRYQLQRVPGSSLALQVIDQDMGDEVRALASLSGGETFLVSLALALALSAISSRNLQIQSLFIDEGFGSLDPDSLDVVMSCLDKLQATGRQVTAISHVQSMVERISAKIRLQPLGGGRSQLLTEID